MLKAYRTRTFTRWMRKEGLTDKQLQSALQEMLGGLIDADLGGHLFKKRVALPGQGKRGGARTIVASKVKTQWFFLFGFAKNERSNLDQAEIKALQELASELLSLNEVGVTKLIEQGKLMEVENGHSKN